MTQASGFLKALQVILMGSQGGELQKKGEWPGWKQKNIVIEENHVSVYGALSKDEAQLRTGESDWLCWWVWFSAQATSWVLLFMKITCLVLWAP